MCDEQKIWQCFTTSNLGLRTQKAGRWVSFGWLLSIWESVWQCKQYFRLLPFLWVEEGYPYTDWLVCTPTKRGEKIHFWSSVEIKCWWNEREAILLFQELFIFTKLQKCIFLLTSIGSSAVICPEARRTFNQKLDQLATLDINRAQKGTYYVLDRWSEQLNGKILKLQTRNCRFK